MDPFSLDHIIPSPFSFPENGSKTFRPARLASSLFQRSTLFPLYLKSHTTSSAFRRLPRRGTLSLLSSCQRTSIYYSRFRLQLLLEVWGFEPQTYGLQSRRSSQLSYTPSSYKNGEGKEGS